MALYKYRIIIIIIISFGTCCQESLSTLVEYFVDTHISSLESVSYVDTFRRLEVRRLQLKEHERQRLIDFSNRYVRCSEYSGVNCNSVLEVGIQKNNNTKFIKRHNAVRRLQRPWRNGRVE